MRLKLRHIPLLAAGALLCGCSNSNTASQPTAALADQGSNSIYHRYLTNCLDRNPAPGSKDHVITCTCIYEYAKRSYSETEMELVLARVSGDKIKEKEALAKPDYNEKQYLSKVSQMKVEAVACSAPKKAS